MSLKGWGLLPMGNPREPRFPSEPPQNRHTANSWVKWQFTRARGARVLYFNLQFE